jgi:manganese/iron transport system substrate-binding protein
MFVATVPKPGRWLSRVLSLLFVLALMGTGFRPSRAAQPSMSSEDLAPRIMPVSSSVAVTPVALQPGQKLTALATTSLVADVVKQVGGDQIDLKVLLPLGTDPHTFNPTPRDLTAISDAQVIFANGAGLEVFLSGMLQNAGASTPVIAVSDGIPLRHLATDQPGPTPPPGQEENGGQDPHTWFSPVGVMVWVTNTANALVGLDPTHAAGYQARARDYQQQLAQLDGWITEQVAQVPPQNRRLVTDHLEFGYFADRYGFEQVGAVIPAFSTSAQPSAQEMAQLEDAIGKQGVKAVFVSNIVNDSLSRRVATDTGIRLVTLFDGSLGPAGSGAETYLDFMRYDTNTIVQALK